MIIIKISKFIETIFLYIVFIKFFFDITDLLLIPTNIKNPEINLFYYRLLISSLFIGSALVYILLTFLVFRVNTYRANIEIRVTMTITDILTLIFSFIYSPYIDSIRSTQTEITAEIANSYNSWILNFILVLILIYFVLLSISTIFRNEINEWRMKQLAHKTKKDKLIEFFKKNDSSFNHEDLKETLDFDISKNYFIQIKKRFEFKEKRKSILISCFAIVILIIMIILFFSSKELLVFESNVITYLN